MRILQVTEASSAGVGRHVMDLTRGLLRAGHEVDLVYSEARIDDRFRQQLAALDPARVTMVPMARGPRPSDLLAARALRRILRRRGPYDVFHAHSTKAGLLTRCLSRRLARGWAFTPHCPFSMQPDLSAWSRPLLRMLDRSIAHRADRVIAVSADEAAYLRELAPRAGVAVVVNGLDLRAPVAPHDRDTRRAALGIPVDDGPVVGFVGRLSAQKDPALLLRAMARVAAAVPNARLAVAGWGPLEVELRALAAELGIGGRVHWLGYVDGESVLPAFDVFALPSRYEGMPYVLLEALAAGLPIVTTDVGGARHAVVDGGNGFVRAVGDVAGFAAALVRVLTERELRTAFASASAAAAPGFGLARMVDETVAVYRGVLGDGPVGTAVRTGRAEVCVGG
jgi:glycosyltransferase involved in cell wall biosynthesis